MRKANLLLEWNREMHKFVFFFIVILAEPSLLININQPLPQLMHFHFFLAELCKIKAVCFSWSSSDFIISL